MMRYSEVLFLLPILVLVAVRLRTGAMPTGRLLFAALMSIVVLGAVLAWFGADRGVRGPYVPARLQDGRVEPGSAGP